MLRTGAIAATAAAVLVLAAAGPASAAGTRNTCDGMTGATSTVGSTNFLVHYNPGAINATQASGLLSDADAGRSLELNPPFSFQPPPPDNTVTAPAGNNPDARTDVWVYADAGCTSAGSPCGCNGFMSPDSGSQTGWIYINPNIVANKSTIAHEFFHTVQLGISSVALSSLAGTNRVMMREASASWIGALAAGNDGGHQPTYQRTLGVGQTLDFPDSSTEVLYGEWPFFEFENERFGAAVVQDDFAQANSAPAGGQTQWMNAALVARGTTLGAVFADYAATVNAADWPTPLLSGGFPRLSSDTVLGVNANTSTNQADTLNHLATRFYRLTSNACSGQCDATLHLDVGWPGSSGVQASLMRFGTPTGARVPLTNGATGAHADIPFNLNTSYTVAVSNPSLTADAVPISLSANATTPPPATGGGTTTPPKQTTPIPQQQTGIPIPVPTLSLSGKPKVSRSGRSRIIKLTVQSSAAGFVVATLAGGKAKLVAHAAAKATSTSRTFSVVPGTNKLRFTLSRRVKKGRYTLTLTPQSVNFVPGTPVSAGRVSVPKPPKAKKRKSRRARFIY
ncbi:MAG TPA: hypothetical protein VH231_04375 [Solirubrobacteraceae bacterium]|nr:hypothetical protein [Solirubrobacteraceae bacterium]